MYPNQAYPGAGQQNPMYPNQNPPYQTPSMPVPMQGGFVPQQPQYQPAGFNLPPQMPNPMGTAYPPQQQFPNAIPQQQYQMPPQQQYQAPPQQQYQMPPQQQYQNPQMGGAFPQQQLPPQQQQQQIPPQQQTGVLVLPKAAINSIKKELQNLVELSAPVKKMKPSLVPASNFDASNDAAILRKAMKGFGTDEAALINVLCRRSNDQRMQIMKAFKTAYGRDLYDDVKSETSKNFEKVLLALLTPAYDFYAKELYEAMKGVGTDEDVLIEVLCSMKNHEIEKTIAAYQKLYNKSLESNLRSETSGNFKKLLTSLMAAGRDESNKVDGASAKVDALALKKAGVDRMGTDEQEFNRILCSRNYAQLNQIYSEYERLTGSTLEKDIDKEFSGDIKNALLTIVKVSKNPQAYFAEKLHKSMAGLGTNDTALIRNVVTRCEIDMEDIKREFLTRYQKTLKSFIVGDTSGDYRKALLALCGETND